MTAAELLRAGFGRIDDRLWPTAEQFDAIAAAARLWLRILEGDEQTVATMAEVLIQTLPSHIRDWEAIDVARAVLAALTEGEKKWV